MNTEKTEAPDTVSFWDRTGIVLSGACLVHCLALPFLVASLPVFGLGIFLRVDVHKYLAILLIFTSALAFVPGYLTHKDRTVFYWLMPGLSMLMAAAFLNYPSGAFDWKFPVNILGGMCLIRAHVLNRTFCRTCSDCNE